MTYTLPQTAIDVVKQNLHPSFKTMTFVVQTTGSTVKLIEDVEQTDHYKPKTVVVGLSDDNKAVFEGKNKLTFNTSDWSVVENKPAKEKHKRTSGCSLSQVKKWSNRLI